MTTLVTFAPSVSAPFAFQATLDGQVYNVTVTWNVGRQDWFINITDQTSTLIVCEPLIGSPDDYDISLTGGYFTTKMVFRVSTQQFEIA